VSGAISEDSIDLVGLQQALNVDTKYGVNLTNFLSIFGFARQEATKATGYVEFTVSSPGTRTVLIPEGTLVKSSEATELEGLVPELRLSPQLTSDPVKPPRVRCLSNVPALVRSAT